MQLPIRCVAVLLCAVSTGAAFAQSAGTSAVTKAPGISFSYDAQHGLVNANGVQVKPTLMSSFSTTTATGTVRVTVNIKDVSHFISGTTYHCALTAVGGELDTTNGVVSGGIDTAIGVAHWTGANTLSCTMSIPFEWTLVSDPAATPGALLAFAVAAVSPQGVIQRSTLQVDGVEPLPPNGTTSTFSFNVTL